MPAILSGPDPAMAAMIAWIEDSIVGANAFVVVPWDLSGRHSFQQMTVNADSEEEAIRKIRRHFAISRVDIVNVNV